MLQQKEKSERTSITANREIRISRVLNAPIDLVWKVWTNPGHIKNWRGPDGFTNTINEMDLKTGGTWDLIMHGPDGTDYKNKSVFKEIIKHKKIVYEHVSGPRFLATIEFEKQGNKTLLKWHMLFETAEEFIRTVKKFKADEGLKQNVSKLENYLEQILSPQPFVVERTYNAAVENVWRAITDKNEMKQWYFDLNEFKPEVGFEFQFTAGDDQKKWLHRCKVTEVVPGKKITYSWRYDGYEGNSFVTWELFPEGSKTRLKLTHAGLESFPADTFPDLKKENFVAGWADIIGRSLKNYLEKI